MAQQRTRTYTADVGDLVIEADETGVPVEELTVEEEAPSAMRRFLSGAGEMLNPVTAVKGIAQAVTHPIDTATALYEAQAAQVSKAAEAYRQGRTSEMVGHGAAAALPVIGPVAAEIGERIGAGDVAGGLGATAGLIGGPAAVRGVSRVAGRVARPVAERTAETLYQSALKPTKTVLKDVRVPAGAGPDAARQTLVRTGLREEIPISPAGARKVETLVDSLNAEVQSRLSAATQAGKTIDPVEVEQAISAVAKDFTKQINAQPDLAAIETVRDNFMTNPTVARTVQGPAGKASLPGPVPIQTAQDMKVNTYKGLRGKYGVERGATIEAEKAGARNIREQIERESASDIGALNAREGSLFPLEEAIADAMRRRGNYGIFGLTPVVASIPAVTHGNLWPLLAAMVDRAPGVVSRTGIWINRTGTGRRTGRATQRVARAATVLNQDGVLIPATVSENPEETPQERARR